MTPAPGTAMPRAQAPTGMPGLCIPGISTPGPGCMLTPSGAREPGPLAAAQKWVTLANEDLNLEPTCGRAPTAWVKSLGTFLGRRQVWLSRKEQALRAANAAR
eukprot:364362-Chlamydomonas_euryale.AAC.18